MAILPNDRRWSNYRLLLRWFSERDITLSNVAEKLGLTAAAVRAALQSETMRPIHHVRLVELGVPQDLLPPPVEKKPGRQPRVPRWPEKSAAQ